MHGPALGRFVSVFADTSRAREYVYATNERGTKTPPANAHVRERVRAYSPVIISPLLQAIALIGLCDAGPLHQGPGVSIILLRAIPSPHYHRHSMYVYFCTIRKVLIAITNILVLRGWLDDRGTWLGLKMRIMKFVGSITRAH
jgi:hypothetical protein